MPDQQVPVVWQVARDEDFAELVSQGVSQADPMLAHSVHVDAIGLDPDTQYFYRFKVADAVSPTGRTRTLPCPGAPTEVMRFAFASCQKYRAGRYTAHAHLAQEDINLVFFLGDYIYESGGRGPIHSPYETEEVRDLEGYRNRYALYKSDPNLKLAHAAHPWIVTWDDHEVENNYAGKWPSDQGQSPEEFLKRRAAAYQAYYEHQPIRANPPTNGALNLYRSFQFGDLANFFVLDTRQYRDKYACGGGLGEVCPERDDPERSMLGLPQEEWLHEGLAKTGSQWNVIAQSVVMSALDFDGTFANFDQWDGYPASRQRLLDAIRTTKNVVVLSGDIHAAGVANLTVHGHLPESRPIATELVTTSISSGGEDGNMLIAELLPDMPHIHYANGAHRGYGRCEVTHGGVNFDLRVVSTVLASTADIRTEAQWRINAGSPVPIQT